MAKITVLGPVSPFRGGIARHTTRLARELTDDPGNDVSIFSFSSLYPGFLYPGQDDRDPEASPPEFASTHYCLNSVNPFSWGQTAKEILAQKPDLVIIPAWTFFVSPALGFIAKKLMSDGISVVQIVHNASDHETAGWKTALTRAQLKHASAYVTHNEQIADDIRKIDSQKPISRSARIPSMTIIRSLQAH